MTADDLRLVHYCHRSCAPLQNIMRLPKEEAFALAREMAAQNRETTAFYRFADFARYYPERLKTDALLRARFTALGGGPRQEHPLSFVLHGSDFLDDWFGRGIIAAVPLCRVPSDSVSFTYGDSMAALARQGGFSMLTKEMLFQAVSDEGGAWEDFLRKAAERCRYIEAQVWDDACLAGCTEIVARP